MHTHEWEPWEEAPDFCLIRILETHEDRCLFFILLMGSFTVGDNRSSQLIPNKCTVTYKELFKDKMLVF